MDHRSHVGTHLYPGLPIVTNGARLSSEIPALFRGTRTGGSASAAYFASFAAVAVRAMRELVHRQGDLPESDALRVAGTMRYIVGQTDDAKEGPRAFSEKLPPVFKG